MTDAPQAGPDAVVTSLQAQVAELSVRVTRLEALLAGTARSGDVSGAAPVESAPAPVAAMSSTLGPLESAHQVVTAVLTAALAGVDAEDEMAQAALEAFGLLVHSDRRGTPLLDEEVRVYKWRPLVAHVHQYLSKPGDPTSFEIVRTQPSEITAKIDQVRLYLRAEKRMPPPLTLRRDAQAGGAWRIESSSL